MTIQVVNARLGRNKLALQEALNAEPGEVEFLEPTPWADRRFTAAEVPVGAQFPVVMDHPKRMRFASIRRLGNGKFSVG